MDIDVSIIRSKRKTVAIQVKAGQIIVKAPLQMKTTEIQELLEQKKEWIDKHLALAEEENKLTSEIKPYTMEEINKLADKAVKVIPERVKHYAPLIGVDYGRITIRNQRSRWGSCSSKGNLNFNCLLMEMPDEIIDSVVVHELCHLTHMNHSKEFWKLVESVIPDYKLKRKWLKENGHTLHL